MTIGWCWPTASARSGAPWTGSRCSTASPADPRLLSRRPTPVKAADIFRAVGESHSLVPTNWRARGRAGPDPLPGLPPGNFPNAIVTTDDGLLRSNRDKITRRCGGADPLQWSAFAGPAKEASRSQSTSPRIQPIELVPAPDLQEGCVITRLHPRKPEELNPQLRAEAEAVGAGRKLRFHRSIESLLFELKSEIPPISNDVLFLFIYDAISDTVQELESNSRCRPKATGEIKQTRFSTGQADLIEVRLEVQDTLGKRRRRNVRDFYVHAVSISLGGREIADLNVGATREHSTRWFVTRGHRLLRKRRSARSIPWTAPCQAFPRSPGLTLRVLRTLVDRSTGSRGEVPS